VNDNFAEKDAKDFINSCAIINRESVYIINYYNLIYSLIRYMIGFLSFKIKEKNVKTNLKY
jgi:hypothetical protein